MGETCRKNRGLFKFRDNPRNAAGIQEETQEAGRLIEYRELENWFR